MISYWEVVSRSNVLQALTYRETFVSYAILGVMSAYHLVTLPLISVYSHQHAQAVIQIMVYNSENASNVSLVKLGTAH